MSAGKRERLSERQGARDAMKALGGLISSAGDSSRCGDLPEDFYSWRYDDAKRLADQFASVPEYARGAIMALAEFIHYSISTGEPNLDCWQPVTAMTQAHLRQEIDAMREGYRQDAARLPAAVSPAPTFAVEGGAA